MEQQEHSGKVAVITGGGRGFGASFGKALAERGAHVVLLDVDGEAARSAAKQIVEAGGSAEGRMCDVTDTEGIEAVIEVVVARHGGIDMLINNAGLHSAAYNKPTSELGVEAVRRLFDVNVHGVIVCTLACKDAMTGRAGASIVNLSSSAAYASRTAYGVSKLAVRGLTASFAHELAADGIRVNAIAPGLIFTDTIREELEPAAVAKVMAGQILDREGEEIDIVESLLFLVSDKASFITGETLRVTGGYALSV